MGTLRSLETLRTIRPNTPKRPKGCEQTTAAVAAVMPTLSQRHRIERQRANYRRSSGLAGSVFAILAQSVVIEVLPPRGVGGDAPYCHSGDSLPSYFCSPLLFSLSDSSSSSAFTETHETFMYIGRGVGRMGLTPLIVDISR